MKDSIHFGDMLNERGIEREWADFDENDRVVGVEFLGISSRATNEELSNLEFQTA
jgi:hypothetical protein